MEKGKNISSQHTLILHAAESYKQKHLCHLWHFASRQICINQSGSQHSAARWQTFLFEKILVEYFI
jgi:hypothetical protein